MIFYKYQHLEKHLDRPELSGLLEGTLTIQPKLDGSNCQIWMEDGKLVISSRNHILGNHKDNHGCYQTLKNDARFIEFFKANTDVKLIGEWLVPHSIKYREDAYKKLYVFDGIKIGSENGTGQAEYIDYGGLQSHLTSYEISHVPYGQMNAKDWDKSYKTMIQMCPEFNWLLPNPETDEGEGIVVKNYGYTNPFGRKVWCKVINEEFYKLKGQKKPKIHVSKDYTIEKNFVEQHLTGHLLSKQLHKLGEFDRKRTGEYIRSCQLEFVEDFVGVEDNVDVKILNNIVAQYARNYLMDCNLL